MRADPATARQTERISEMSEDLQALVLPEEYRASRAHLFPSPQSLTWFMRRHRDPLLAAGALKMIAGKFRLVPARADAVLEEISRQDAVRASRRGAHADAGTIA